MITKFDVKGMSCGNCVSHVTKAIQSLEGVKTVRVSLADSEAVVEYDEQVVAPAAIVDAVDEEGYEAKLAA